MPLLQDLAFLCAAVVALGIGAQWLSWRLKLPSILLLLVLGIVLGPVLGILDRHRIPDDPLFSLVPLGVAVILFEGALTLRFHEIRGHGNAVRNLVTFGALLNGALVTLATWWILGLALGLALLFGAVMTVTGPTVIAPLLRTVRPTPAVANVLQWEGILIDPLGALLAVLAYGFVAADYQGGTLALVFLKTILVGLSLGGVGALALALPIRRKWLPEHLRDVGALAMVLLVFALSNHLAHESGLLAVTVMGVALANVRELETASILHFKESLTLLLVSVLFVVLAARIEPAQLRTLGWRVLPLLGVILFVARPAAVFVSTLGSRLSWRERLLVAWIGPRGIVAAAVISVFALGLARAGVAEAELLVPLTFAVIVVTVVVLGLSARPLARMLGVAEPVQRGVLILGANPVGLAIAKALNGTERRVVLADTSQEMIAEARMAGLEVYFGSILSDHADRHLDLFGIGRLFAFSRIEGLNELACDHFREEFGEDEVYALAHPRKQDAPAARSGRKGPRGRRLFGAEVTHASLASALARGASVRSTKLTESFDFGHYLAREGVKILPLFAVDPRGRLAVFTAEAQPKPGPGWTVFGLVEQIAPATAGA